MMKLSCQSQLRKYFIEHDVVPTFSDVREQLGDELAQVFIDECPESLRDEMGLSDMLPGPGQTLWTSPSDLLIGKVALKPPLTMKHVRALTHEGILNLGEILEAEWLAELKHEKELALKNLEELMMLTAEKDKQQALINVLDECQRKYQNLIEQLKQEFEAILAPEMRKLEDSLREYYEQLMAEKINEVLAKEESERNEQIASAVEDAVQALTQKFMMDLEKQEQELNSIFKARIEGQAERFKAEVDDQQEVFGVVMKHLKHNIQCHNIASLVYVLCLERKKCCAEQQVIVDALNAEMAKMERSQVLVERKLKELQAEVANKERQLQVRNDCLMGVIEQFQKFINYTLRAVPTQAEFLLSVEKILAFEVSHSFVPMSHPARKMRVAKEIMPWCHMSEHSIPPPADLTTAAYRECENQIDKRTKKSPSEEDLVAVTYRKKLYVREDFRDKVARDLHQTPDATLWSKDIQNFIKLLTEQEQQPAIETPPESSNLSIHFIETTSHNPTGLLGIRDSLAISKLCPPPPNVESIEISEPDTDDENGKSKKPNVGVSLLAVVDSVAILKDKIGSASKLALAKSATKQYTKSSHNVSDTTLQLKKLSRGSKQSESMTPVETLEIVLSDKCKKTRRSSSLLKSPILKVAAKQDKSHRVSSVHMSSGRKTGRKSDEPRTSSLISASPPHSVRMSGDSRRHNLSKLSYHRDSLEVISVHFDPLKKRMKDILTPAPAAFDADYPVMKYVINVPSETKGVCFNRVVEVFNECSEPEKPWMIYEESQVSMSTKLTSSENAASFLAKPNEARIVGNPTVEENKTIKDFEMHRMNSLVELLKSDDSLIRMFTRGGQ